MVASHVAPTGDLAHNPGMCPDWELNQRSFGSQPMLNPLSYASQADTDFLKKKKRHLCITQNSQISQSSRILGTCPVSSTSPCHVAPFLILVRLQDGTNVLAAVCHLSLRIPSPGPASVAHAYFATTLAT